MERPFWKSPFTVVIVGRPNVGKSTFFNIVAGTRVAIVDPTPGVTRDRLLRHAMHDDVPFDIMDTGGIGIVDMQDLEELVELQIQTAIGMADLIIFICDGRDGITPLDKIIAESLRRTGKPVLLAVNKCDVPKFDADAEEFHRLGIPEVFPMSVKERRGVDDLLDRVVSLIPEDARIKQEDEGLKLVLLGRRNVGKSSFVNYLAGEERVIVSEVPGTTRDAVDVAIQTEKFKLVAIDTAGVRKKSSMSHPVEIYSTARTESALTRADVVVLMIDAKQAVSALEKRLAKMITEEFKPCIIAVNKWDLAGEADPNTYTEYIGKTLPGLAHCPIVYMSVKEGSRVTNIVKIAEDLDKQTRQSWPTPLLNEIAQEAWERNRPRVKHSKLPKIYYCTQIGTRPPSFLFFVNMPEFFTDTYTRYLVNYLRKRLDAPEVPIRVIMRQRRPSSRTQEN